MAMQGEPRREKSYLQRVMVTFPLAPSPTSADALACARRGITGLN